MALPQSGIGRVGPAAIVRLFANHAAWCPIFNGVLVRTPIGSCAGVLTLRSNNPFFRCGEARATPSRTPRIGFASRTVTTVPSSVRHRAIVDEHCWYSQKYSTLLDLGEPKAGSASRRKRLPSPR